VQDALKALDALYEERAQRRYSETAMSTIDMASAMGGLQQTSPEEDDRIELTIKEYQEFTAKLQSEVLDKHLPQIMELSEKIFTFKGGLVLRSDSPQV
jgi:hypothetical protein